MPGIESSPSSSKSPEGEDIIRDFFAHAEDGLTPIPQEVVVEGIEDVVNDTHLSPDALEAYRVSHEAE